MYHYRLIARSVVGADTSDDIAFQTLEKTIEIDHTKITISPAIVSVGDSIVISVVVKGSNPNVELIYGRGSDLTGHSISMTQVIDTLFSRKIPRDSVTAEGVWFRILASNTRGSVIYPSSTGPLSITVSIPNLTAVKAVSEYPIGIPQDHWFGLCMPFQSTFNLETVLGKQEFVSGKPSNWQLRVFDTDIDSFVNSNTSILQSGRSYLIYHRSKSAKDIFSAMTSATTLDINIFSDTDLIPGWNFVAGP
jgi:hypothetical protein